MKINEPHQTLIYGLNISGYYADPEAECQVFHICSDDGQGGMTKYSFLCPNGTIFNQGKNLWIKGVV